MTEKEITFIINKVRSVAAGTLLYVLEKETLPGGKRRAGRKELLKKMNTLDHLILFRTASENAAIRDMTALIAEAEKEEPDREKAAGLYASCAGTLAEMAFSCGFTGNLWQTALAFFLVNDENAYSKACEIRGSVPGSLNIAALQDLTAIKALFDYDLGLLETRLSLTGLTMLTAYEASDDGRKRFSRRIRTRISDLAADLAKAGTAEAFKTTLEAFYGEYGVGRIGLHKAFRIEELPDGHADIVPITNVAHVSLDDLVGYESAKQKLVENTEAFIEGRRANNCMLFGDAGTGKSTSVKAILNQYYDRGLRIIEVYKHQISHIHEIISKVKDRNYRFILFMDDLSFEDFEVEYKYLKAVIEGGLERKPENVLIYVTSNRRHLIREDYSDKAGTRFSSDIHTSDTVQEKTSLSARFGVTIYFPSPSKMEFNRIVRELAKRAELDIPDEELMEEANKWEIAHSGFSGRTAQQFIDHMSGLKA